MQVDTKPDERQLLGEFGLLIVAVSWSFNSSIIKITLDFKPIFLKGIMESALVFVAFDICEIDLVKNTEKSLNNKGVIDA